MAQSLHVCYDMFLPQDLRVFAQQDQSPADRAALLRAKKWPVGATLRVRFMGGTPAQHNTVKQFAPQWSTFANLKLDFNNAPNAEIRVAFADDGAWSYIGKDCLSIPLNQATMNFGWLDEAVVLHEFGHALGLIHEHQNPSGGIKWNKAQVYHDLGGAPNFWDKATIDHNMFDTYALDQLNATTLDPTSIMMYRIPASWTTDGFHSDFNAVLSGKDKTFIGDSTNYPFDTGGGGIVELPVSEIKVTEARIGQPGEQDLYSFTAADARSYTIETSGPTDLVMSLYGPDSRTKLVAQDDDSGIGHNPKISVDLTPGTYYVQVQHYNRTGGTGAYSIVVRK